MFFDKEIEFDNRNNHSLWIEKYRPFHIDEYLTNDEFKNVLNKYIENQDIPNLLFYSKQPGTGKTTLAKILARDIQCDSLYMNASDENGVDVIRNKVKRFAESSGTFDKKIVIFDEVDYLTTQSQAICRGFFEEYSENTRFILTCNYVDKIIEPLKSRLQSFEILPPDKKTVAMSLKTILDKENIEYEVKDLADVINAFYPDLRRCIGHLQQYSTSGKLSSKKIKIGNEDNVPSEVLKMLKEKQDILKIRQYLIDHHIANFQFLYEHLSKNIYEFDKIAEVLILLAKYQYQSSFVIDQELNFMAFVAELYELK